MYYNIGEVVKVSKLLIRSSAEGRSKSSLTEFKELTDSQQHIESGVLIDR